MKNLSRVMKSVLITSGIAAEHDKRQQVSASYEIPNKESRLLAAELVFEEAKELIEALGCRLDTSTDKGVAATALQTSDLNIKNIIDGGCDLEFVTKRVLAICGVPDKPHLKEVCKANERKFPGGVATMDKQTGKYLKPKGWKVPDHNKVMLRNNMSTDMIVATSKLLKKFRKKEKSK